MAKKITARDVQRQLKTVLGKEIVKVYSKTFQQKIVTAFNKIKRDMVEEFRNHPVTVEIKAGPDAQNTSGTLNGYGNLFSFIGFEEGDNPTDNIEGLLNLSRIEYSRETKEGFLMKIYLPSKQEIFLESPMPWAKGRSWAEGIERGISGFGRYLNKDSINSRSGTGIEVDSVIRKGKFSNVPYISALLNKYNQRFQEINKVVVISGVL
jgi:hypothetical protein